MADTDYNNMTGRKEAIRIDLVTAMKEKVVAQFRTQICGNTTYELKRYVRNFRI